MSILLNLIVIPLVNIFIFPLSIISFIFPSLSYILYFFTSILQNLSMLVYNLNLGIVVFSKPSLIIVFVYYLFIYLYLYIHKFYNYFVPSLVVTSLDVGQGDSILIRYPYNYGNVLIDTGGIVNSDYSIVLNRTISYFKSIDINRLDALIITHGDHDHMGEAINLVNNFKVEKVIFNCGEFNELEQDLIKVLDKKNIKYYSCIKELNIDGNKLYFLNNKNYDNENDN